jgi:acyl carrier protein
VKKGVNEMTNKDIEEILISEAASILAADRATIAPDVPLHEMGIDSLSFVELLVFIEKKFDLKLIESGLSQEDFQSISALAARIGRSIGAAP